MVCVCHIHDVTLLVMALFLVATRESPAKGEMLNYFYIENSASIRKFRQISSFQLNYALTQVLAIFFSLSTFYKLPAVL